MIGMIFWTISIINEMIILDLEQKFWSKIIGSLIKKMFFKQASSEHKYIYFRLKIIILLMIEII